MVKSLYSHRLFYFIGGNRHRSDFLYASTETGLPLLYLWEEENSQAKLLTPGEEPVYPLYSAAALHPSKPLVVFPKDQGGNADYEVYTLDYSKNDLRRITGPIGRIFYTFWAGDDNWIVVGHDKQSVYARSLSQDGTMNDLYTTSEQMLGASYDNHRNLLVVSVGREAARLAVIDACHASTIRWVPEVGIPPFFPPTVYSEKGLLAYPVDKKTHQELVVRSIETHEELDRVRIPGFAFEGSNGFHWVDENHLFGIINNDGVLSPRMFNLRTEEWSPPLSKVSALYSTVTKNGPVWVSNSLVQPPFLQALRNGRVVDLTTAVSVAPEVHLENYHYRSFDGRKIQGWLLRNPNPKAQLVMYLHGGPTFLQGDWWYPEIPAVAIAGYHVFIPNFRGSDGFGMEFRDLNIGDLGGGDLQDVRFGALDVQKLVGTSSKPALFGGSYGGYLTLQGLVTQPDEWAGGVAIAPDSDWSETYDLADAHYRKFCVHFFGGTPKEKPDLYKDRSPITHLSHLVRPLLILHGDNDMITPLQPVKKFEKVAKQMALPVDLVITPDEGHGMLHNNNAIRDTVLTLDHLDRIFQTKLETIMQ